MPQIEIWASWDGAPLPPAQWITLTLLGERDSLCIEVDAPYFGDPPPSASPGPTDALWEHEVVELFVLGKSPWDAPRYTEIELGPHGHHLVLQLEGVRQPVRTLLPLQYEACIRDDRWQGRAVLDAALLPPAPHRINAYAIHGAGPSRRHAALFPVPGPRPDFHRLECFRPFTLTDG